MRIDRVSTSLRRGRFRDFGNLLKTDPAIIRMIRPLGIGLSPAVECVRRGRDFALQVRSGCVVPPRTPLALVPQTAAITLSSLMDSDRTFLVPMMEDLRSCVDDHHEELVDVIGPALLVSLHLSLEKTHIPPSFWWYQYMVDAHYDYDNEDATLFANEIGKVYNALCEKNVVPNQFLYLRCCRYVLSGLMNTVAAPVGDRQNESVGSDVCVPSSCLVPVLDLMVNRHGTTPSVILHHITAKQVKEETVRLPGAAQHLMGAKHGSEYWVAVSARELNHGDILSLGDLDSTIDSPLQRLRLRLS